MTGDERGTQTFAAFRERAGSIRLVLVHCKQGTKQPHFEQWRLTSVADLGIRRLRTAGRVAERAWLQHKATLN